MIEPPGEIFGTIDVNLAWDSARNRFVFAALGNNTPRQIYYGYSTDASGTSWVNSGAVFSSSLGSWDFPSIGVDASGRVIIGAVEFSGQTAAGYWSVVSSDGSNFSSPSPVVSVDGAESRLVAAGNLFESFVPVLSGSLPTEFLRYESSDGVSWTGPLSVGMGSFGTPLNNTPTSPYLFYAPLVTATGYTNGLWAISFQVNNGGFNNVVVCTSNRGCGFVNAQANDQFLSGVSVLADQGYWVTYYTYGTPGTPPLMTQAIYLAPGAAAIGANVVTNIDPTSWTTTQNRCLVTCYAAGDFNQIASNPFLAASSPFIQRRPYSTNDLFQSFIQDPQTASNLMTFKPNFVGITKGASISNLGLPVPPASQALPPYQKIGITIPKP